MTGHDLYLLSPQLAMLGVAVSVLVLDMLFRNKWVLFLSSLVGLLVPAILALILWFDSPANGDQIGLFGALIVDKFSIFFQLLFIAVAALVVLASVRYEQKMPGLRGEYVTLMLFSVTGMMLLSSTRELISIYVALELTSLPIAALSAFLPNRKSVESGLKFLILSGVSSALLLYGMVYIYGFTGTTILSEIFENLQMMQGTGELDATIPFGSYALLFGIVIAISGFAFKIAAVPAQMWVPDVYEGSPTTVTAFLSVASKAAGFAVILRVVYTAFNTIGGEPDLTLDWSALFAVLAVVSMAVGNLMALSQTNIKRLLAYSTVAHAGYILVGLAAVFSRTDTTEVANQYAGPQGVLFYLIAYGLTNLATFFAVIAISNRTASDSIESFSGMVHRAPMAALVLALGLLSLLGMPPTVGFMAKAFIFSAAVNADLLWLAVVGMILSVVSAFYYLRIVRIMFEQPSTKDEKISVDFSIGIASAAMAVGIIVFGFAPGFVLRISEVAVKTLVLPGTGG